APGPASIESEKPVELPDYSGASSIRHRRLRHRRRTRLQGRRYTEERYETDGTPRSAYHIAPNERPASSSMSRDRITESTLGRSSKMATVPHGEKLPR